MAVSGTEWLKAQNSVLGSALLEPSLVPQVIAQTTAADYSGPCQTIYNAMRKLFLSGAAVDVVSIAADLGTGYQEYLAQLMEITPTAANLDSYIRLCREQSKVLTAQELARQMAEADSTDEVRALLEQVSGLMVDKPSLRITTMSDALKSFMARHTAEKQYLTWPVRELDDRIYAELGDFLVIAGYPSSGKSAWALQCAWHWAQQYKVGFFSLETSAEKLFDRQMSAVAGLSMDSIKRNAISDSDWARVCDMTAEITTQRNLELIPAAGMGPADVRAVTMMRGYQIILIDYLQLLQGSGNNRTEQVTGISIALHTMAQSMGVTVVALSQLKRQGQGADAPDMSYLRESGQIEQDADLIQILHLEDKNKPAGNRILRIAKNKEGTCPNILLAFDGKHQTFSRAVRQGNVIGQCVSAGKKARQQNRTSGQMQMQDLPGDYQVPFD